MKLLPENPTQSDYLHAIRAVAARGDMSAVPKLKELFNLADAGMFAETGVTNVKPMGAVTICRNGYIQEVETERDAAKEWVVWSAKEWAHRRYEDWPLTLLTAARALKIIPEND